LNDIASFLYFFLTISFFLGYLDPYSPSSFSGCSGYSCSFCELRALCFGRLFGGGSGYASEGYQSRLAILGSAVSDESFCVCLRCVKCKTHVSFSQRLIPTPQDIRVALYPATSVAILVMILLILLYIPSATTTILLYRCGQLPSLGSKYFVKYRSAVDTVRLSLAISDSCSAPLTLRILAHSGLYEYSQCYIRNAGCCFSLLVFARSVDFSF
jgi:hypothetical protein